MFRADPETEQHFLAQFKKSTASSGQFSVDNIASFDRKLHAHLSDNMAPRPWLMSATVFFYQVQLYFYEKRLAANQLISTKDRIAQTEHIESLHFAIHYGRRGNANQRAWCLQAINAYRIAPLDAPFLVWNRVINLRHRTIVFGHWDWIFGIFMMLPALEFFLLALISALSSNTLSILRAMLTMVFLAISWGIYDFFISNNFRVFRVGSRYFKPHGWRYTPLQR